MKALNVTLDGKPISIYNYTGVTIHLQNKKGEIFCELESLGTTRWIQHSFLVMDMNGESYYLNQITAPDSIEGLPEETNNFFYIVNPIYDYQKELEVGLTYSNIKRQDILIPLYPTHYYQEDKGVVKICSTLCHIHKYKWHWDEC